MKNLVALMSAGIVFILPLQDNTMNMETESYQNKDIYKVDTGDNGGNRVSAIQKKAQELLEAINVDLLR